MSTSNNIIYLTHCCAKKNKNFKGTDLKVTPDILYTATPTQRFMNNCKNKKIRWAIFSDKYGVWFSDIPHEWYEKNPNKVTEKEFDELVKNFDESLKHYDKIYFYHNPGRFHKLYKRLLETSELRSKINLITHLKDIDSK